MLNKNTWNHVTEYKLFVLRIVTWSVAIYNHPGYAPLVAWSSDPFILLAFSANRVEMHFQDNSTKKETRWKHKRLNKCFWRGETRVIFFFHKLTWLKNKRLSLSACLSLSSLPHQQLFCILLGPLCISGLVANSLLFVLFMCLLSLACLFKLAGHSASHLLHQFPPTSLFFTVL